MSQFLLPNLLALPQLGLRLLPHIIAALEDVAASPDRANRWAPQDVKTWAKLEVRGLGAWHCTAAGRSQPHVRGHRH